MNAKTAQTTTAGAASGRMIRQSAVNRLAPSTSAASSSSIGIVLKYPIRHPGGERHRERQVRQDQGAERVTHAEGVRHHVERDEQDRARCQVRVDQHPRQPGPAEEAQARQRVAGHRPEEHGDDRRRDADDQAVHELDAELRAGAKQDVVVVLQCPGARHERHDRCVQVGVRAQRRCELPVDRERRPEARGRSRSRSRRCSSRGSWSPARSRPGSIAHRSRRARAVQRSPSVSPPRSAAGASSRSRSPRRRTGRTAAGSSSRCPGRTPAVPGRSPAAGTSRSRRPARRSSGCR